MVAVLNQSTKVSDGDLHTMVDALNEQMIHDVAPAWGRIPWENHVGGRGYVHHVVVDYSTDVKGALAYHDLDKLGHPILVTMAGEVLDHGGTMLGPDGVCSAMAHENIEAFIDPFCNDTTERAAGRYYWHEACDATQGQDYTKGTASSPKPYVSNFCLPHWFNPESPDDKVDFQRALGAPFEVGPQGYQVVSTCQPGQQVGGTRKRRARLLARDGRQVDAGPNAWRTLLLTDIGAE